ncbi:hypothetical protein [Desulfurobacterium atlanticum]|uniref:Uncharacterized protein n=1 Tax=Desulfurobacterium atlanticum TaxID=240169 RepID=A0A238ZEV9_9BACT|nr:hypothetical protein [Desulfurobacterium atlanticum]SNR81501.1 hypothetical protein SAMN06265340_10813 [Desulfurobacterium atlanticum]
MALKNKFLILISVFLGLFLAFIAAGILFLYKPDFFLSLIFGKKPIEITEKKETQKLTKKELFQIEEIVTNNLSMIKEGITIHPAIIFKIAETENSTDAYVLTLSELEWPFVKTIVRGGITLDRVKKVYKCSDIFILDFDTKGMVVPPVKSGPFIDKGVIVPGFEGQKPIVSPFYGDCQEISGFVFNQFGDFSGVCKSQDFIPASWINNLNLSTCSIIYGKPAQTENSTTNDTENTTENETENRTLESENITNNTKPDNQTLEFNQTYIGENSTGNFTTNQTE